MGDYSEKRKKSWREIDQARTGGSGASRERESARERQLKQSGALQEYKRQLEAFFDGRGEAPASVKKEFGAVGVPSGVLQKLAAIKNAAGTEDLTRATAAFLEAGHEFPDTDLELHLKLLEHPDERLVHQALTRLLTLFDQKLVAHRRGVILRLETLELSAEDDEVRELATLVKEKILI